METQHITSVKRHLTQIEEYHTDYQHDYKPPTATTIREQFYLLEQIGWTHQRKNGQYALDEDLDTMQVLTAYYSSDSDLLRATFYIAKRSTSIYAYNNMRGSYFPDTVFDRLLIQIQASVVLDDAVTFQELVQYISKQEVSYTDRLEQLLYQDILAAASADRQPIGKGVLSYLLNMFFQQSLLELAHIPEVYHQMAAQVIEQGKRGSDEFLATYSLALILLGQFDRLEKVLDNQTGIYADQARATLTFIRGDAEQAAKWYNLSFSKFRQEGHYNKAYPAGSLPIFWFMLCVQTNADGVLQELEYGQKHFAANPTIMLKQGDVWLECMAALLQNKHGVAAAKLLRAEPESILDILLAGTLMNELKHPLPVNLLVELYSIHELSVLNEYHWLWMEVAGILAQHEKRVDQSHNMETDFKAMSSELGVTSVFTFLPEQEPWERTLLGITQYLASNKPVPKEEHKNQRLVAFLSVTEKNIDLGFKIQSISKRGGWTPGRKVDLHHIYPFLEKYANHKEQRILRAFEEWQDRYYWRSNADGQEELRLLRALVGFPELYEMNNPDQRIELREDKPQLLIQERDQQLQVHIKYLPIENGSFAIFPDGPNQYALVCFQPEELDVLQLFGAHELTFPPSAADTVKSLLEPLQAILTVETLLEEDYADLPQVDGDPRPYLHLLPLDSGFMLEAYVKPHPDISQVFKPGDGLAMYRETVGDEAVLIQRSPEEERDRLDTIIQALALPERSADQWTLDTPESCLEVLHGLAPFREKGEVVIVWPKGEQLNLVGSLDTNSMSLRVGKGTDYWFAVDGEARVNESMVIGFQKLLEWSEKTQASFLELTDGQYIAITRQLREQLNRTRLLLQKGPRNQSLVHALSGEQFEEVWETEEVISGDADWQQYRERINRARSIRPRVPSGFKATLRPYQKEGFRWMMQLAAWGVGGILADDMGLGKTIQALAVLSARANQGTALVVAPASVCRNWLRETEKFAPALTPRLFGEGDREAMLTQLGPKDLLICSYGLLQSEISRIKDIPFSMVILDEAQAIKNPRTKRFKACMQLNADTKLATTGTPVENHLGELWSLFAFLNPGLLGSEKAFAQKYGTPIRDGDQLVLQQLRKVVSPFILRRQKKQVLKELPPKTEINHLISMPEEERAFYEATRRIALEKVQKGNDNLQSGQRHFQILAELTRLRRLCCHPSLVSDTSRLPGAKLEAFKEIVTDLLENEHRVLVFSQFVSFLQIVRNWVQQKKITYQYLDGSTPTKKRALAVQAFQEGEGDLFLISLKAGGVGLNLTAADYVIILDPWWNPAVEDQAADRAHRIGQLKSVTVYRLILEDTIEERIVQLHQDKKELADSILMDTEHSSKVTTEELLSILQDTGG